MSYIEISRENFFYNLNQIAAKTQSKEKVALVLKDNAYGHGLNLMAKLAAEWGVRHSVVRTMAEAAQIRDLFETVLVLSDTPAEDPGQSIRIAVNSLDQLRRIPPHTSIELKVDTGMHRNGIVSEELTIALDIVGARQLRLTGIMTHYRSADEMGSDFFWQRKRFETVRGAAEKLGVGDIRWHSCNSAALFRTQCFDEDIARIGIAAYGCLRMPDSFHIPHLKPVMTLWAERVATRNVRKSERIGYGGEGQVDSGMVSTYDIGYGDGWLRGNAANPYRLPDGRDLVGRVSMDLISVEGEDDKLCLFDDASEAAEQFNTIGYDILVKLSPDIRRIVV